jgi:DNA polymerase delta subunit 1
MIFQAVSWYLTDDAAGNAAVEDRRCTIYVFGRTACGKRVCLRIVGFCPSFLVRFNSGRVDAAVGYIRMSTGDWKKTLDKGIEKKVWVKTSHFCGAKDERAKSMWGFTNGAEMELKRFSFTSLVAYQRALNKFKFKGEKLLQYLAPENEDREPYVLHNVMDPLLQFFHAQNLQPATWLEVRGPTRESHDTNADLEFEVNYTDVVEAEDRGVCPALLQMSFDIEVYSCDGRFPSAKVGQNSVFQIGVTLKAHAGETERILLQLGPELPPLPGTTVLTYETEAELIVGFRDLVVERKPDVIFHYNGDSFDWSYLFERARVCKVLDDLARLSPIKAFRCRITEENFASSARGFNKYFRVDLPGILNVDVLTYCKQDTTNPLESFKLDNVAEVLLGDKKHPVSPKEIFAAYKAYDPALLARVGEYCVQDTELVQRLADKLDVLNALFAMANICYVPVAFLLTRGQQIKMYSQLFRFATRERYVIPWFELGYDPNLSSFGDYDLVMPKGALVLEPMTGYYQDPIATLDFSALYPSIMRAYNVCYSTCVLEPEHDNLPGVEYKDVNCVFEVTRGRLDYESTVTVTEEGKNIVRQRPVLVPEENAEPATQERTMRFAQGTPSVLPKMQAEFAQARAKLKALKKAASSDLAYRVLHSQEIATKVSSNSLYGFTGAHMLKMVEVTAAITAFGRDLISRTKQYMEESLPDVLLEHGMVASRPVVRVIGGDTDSVFAQFVGFDKNEAMRCCEFAAEHFSTHVIGRPPIALEFEKIMLPYLLFKKKRYASIRYTSPTDKGKLDVKGISLKRRDSCHYAKDVYQELLDIVLQDWATGPERCVEALRAQLAGLFCNAQGNSHGTDVPLDLFVISASLRESYKNPKLSHLGARDRVRERDPGAESQPGDRFGYVVVLRDDIIASAREAALLTALKDTLKGVLKCEIKATIADLAHIRAVKATKKAPGIDASSDAEIVDAAKVAVSKVVPGYTDVVDRKMLKAALKGALGTRKLGAANEDAVLDSVSFSTKPSASNSETSNPEAPNLEAALAGDKNALRAALLAPTLDASSVEFDGVLKEQEKLYYRTEDPGHVREAGLKVDLQYYLNNQLRNAIMQLMEIIGKGDETEAVFDEYSTAKRRKKN